VAHQSSVVGVYSTRPLTVGDVYAKAAQDDKVPVAVIGIVPVKVCDQGGAILPGDLLSASDIPGTAMKTSRPGPGTVIGKALEAHEAGEGSILMLVSLR
jgi:hypothetical protein